MTMEPLFAWVYISVCVAWKIREELPFRMHWFTFRYLEHCSFYLLSVFEEVLQKCKIQSSKIQWKKPLAWCQGNPAICSIKRREGGLHCNELKTPCVGKNKHKGNLSDAKGYPCALLKPKSLTVRQRSTRSEWQCVGARDGRKPPLLLPSLQLKGWVRVPLGNSSFLRCLWGHVSINIATERQRIPWHPICALSQEVTKQTLNFFINIKINAVVIYEP